MLFQKMQAKLPKLTLPRYSGEPTKWQQFWDSFESAVHKNSAISNVDKFNYLKGLLDGPAASCIAGVALTNGNYNAALDLLKNRFANPQLLISSHMDALLKLQGSSSGDIRSIRRLYDTIESHIRSLKTLGVESDSYGSFLVLVIMNKIPEEMRLIVSQNFEQSIFDVDSMLRSFKAELEARERCFTCSQVKNRNMTASNLMQNTSILPPHYLLKGLSSHQLHVLAAWVNTRPDGAILLLISLLERKY